MNLFIINQIYSKSYCFPITKIQNTRLEPAMTLKLVDRSFTTKTNAGLQQIYKVIS